jgi:prepilin-type N-terminal cleavage/methylation domain-containing protein
VKGNIVIERYRVFRQQKAEGKVPETGFTLIELLIVIVVLGILAAIVIFSLTGVTASSAVSACNADAKTVQVAVQAYDSQTGGFPATAVTDTASATTAGLVPAYVHTWPSNGTNYSVQLAASTGVVSVTVGGVTTPYDSESATAGCSQAK